MCMLSPLVFNTSRTARKTSLTKVGRLLIQGTTHSMSSSNSLVYSMTLEVLQATASTDYIAPLFLALLRCQAVIQ